MYFLFCFVFILAAIEREDVQDQKKKKKERERGFIQNSSRCGGEIRVYAQSLGTYLKVL